MNKLMYRFVATMKKKKKDAPNGIYTECLRAILQESEAKLEMKIFNPSSIFVWR